MAAYWGSGPHQDEADVAYEQAWVELTELERAAGLDLFMDLGRPRRFRPPDPGRPSRGMFGRNYAFSTPTSSSGPR